MIRVQARSVGLVDEFAEAFAVLEEVWKLGHVELTADENCLTQVVERQGQVWTSAVDEPQPRQAFSATEEW